MCNNQNMSEESTAEAVAMDSSLKWQPVSDEARLGIEQVLYSSGLPRSERLLGEVLDYPPRDDTDTAVRLAVAHAQLAGLVASRVDRCGISFNAIGTKDGGAYLLVCCPDGASASSALKQRNTLIKEANLIIEGLGGEVIPTPPIK
jgi:hypothetical protein